MITGNKEGVTGRINAFIAEPFNAQGSVLDWFLFLGVVLIAAWFWSRIIAEFSRVVD